MALSVFLLVLFNLFLSSSLTVYGLPQKSNLTEAWPSDAEFALSKLRNRADDKPFYLRISPMGASITNGYTATDQNGFRKYIRDRMRFDGWPVNMVGTVSTGTMRDNDNEGHSGHTIDGFRENWLNAVVSAQPNLILINIGTTDAGTLSVDVTTPKTANRMISLLNGLWAGIPQATIILSTVLPQANADNNKRVSEMNRQYRKLVVDYRSQGKKIVLAEMSTGFITVNDLVDGTHPNDFGYKKMAAVVNWGPGKTDIDGDGRADYCLVATGNGNVLCSRNGGSGDAPIEKYGGFWQDFTSGGVGLTEVFPIKPGVAAGVHLVDLNGDFKADWLFMDDAGKVETWINTRGGLRDGMVPGWRDTGITHAGLITETEGRAWVKFGRIYGSGRRDYIRIEREGTNKFLHVYKNTGHGATYLKADGTRYCDMDGDGVDDYVWISPDGELTVFLNRNSPPGWGQAGVVINLNLPRKSLHLAKWLGSGRCDIIEVNKANGLMRVWENVYNGDWKNSFKYWGPVLGNYGCTQGWGVGENDLGIRFADLTGNGRADYMCIERDGRITGYLNRGNNVLEDVGQIKLATGYDRSNTRFHDVNGDGRADLLWINKYDGNTDVRYNRGEIPSSGSHFFWEVQGTLYIGPDRGSSIQFANIGGQGRADMVQIVPTTNIAYVYYNECPNGGNGGDDPGWGDPQLPNIVVPPHWAKAQDAFPTAICGSTCNSLYPTFDEKGIRTWCQGLVDDPCTKSTTLMGPPAFGYDTASWGRNSDLNCEETGPYSADECFSVFRSLLANPSCAFGRPGGGRACIGYVMDSQGQQLGSLGIIGKCLQIGPAGGCG